MKKNIKDLLVLLLFIAMLLGILTNSILIINNIKDATHIWLFKLFPSLFPFLVIGNILINYNLPYYLSKIFKNNNSFIIVILSLLSGFPSSAKYTKEMYQNNFITIEEANNVMGYSFFANPLFLLSILSLTFSKTLVILIILSHYLANLIILFLIKNKQYSNNPIIKKDVRLGNVLSNAIKDSINTMLLILGTITFYNIIITLLPFKKPIIRTIFTGLLEFSQGLNSLSLINISIVLKAYMAIIFLSFGSLSIHTQIKSILIDTNISYKKFLFFRIIHVFISCFLLTLFIYLNKLFL